MSYIADKYDNILIKVTFIYAFTCKIMNDDWWERFCYYVQYCDL